MDIIIALVFISLTLVAAALVFFFSRLFEGDFEHGERLSLLPLEDDAGESPGQATNNDDKPEAIGSNSSGESEDQSLSRADGVEPGSAVRPLESRSE